MCAALNGKVEQVTWAETHPARQVEEKLQPRKLLTNLEYTTQLNNVDAACQIIRLDWHDCLAPNYIPPEQYQVVIGFPLCPCTHPPVPPPTPDVALYVCQCLYL